MLKIKCFRARDIYMIWTHNNNNMSEIGRDLVMDGDGKDIGGSLILILALTCYRQLFPHPSSDKFIKHKSIFIIKVGWSDHIALYIYNCTLGDSINDNNNGTLNNGQIYGDKKIEFYSRM